MLPPKERKKIPRKATQKNEASFWRTLKEQLKKSNLFNSWTRLETWAMPGVPDLLLCDKSGKFHFVELKSITGKAVNLSPHQVSWQNKHSIASSWILIYKNATQTKKESFHLYHAKQAVELSFDGLDVKAVYSSRNGAVDWKRLFELLLN